MTEGNRDQASATCSIGPVVWLLSLTLLLVCMGKTAVNRLCSSEEKASLSGSLHSEINGGKISSSHGGQVLLLVYPSAQIEPVLKEGGFDLALQMFKY